LKRSLATVTLLVDDYDAAIAWYVEKLGFKLEADVDLGGGKRWVTVTAGGGARLLLARADGAAERAAIGKQAGGRVGFFLETNDFDADHATMVAKGVQFKEAPRRETYGSVAIFADLCGNLWDPIEPRR
jgi:catechol 2,3-dioxygenase-like lactoylglutathione lyase family enzyme